METNNTSSKWFMVFAGFLLYFMVGVFEKTSTSILFNDKDDVTDLMQIIYAFNGTMFFAGLITSILIGKFDCKLTFVSGVIITILSLGQISLSLPDLYKPNTILTCVGVGLGMGLMQFSFLISTAYNFNRFKPLAIGIILCGNQIGSLASLSVQDLLEKYITPAIFCGTFFLCGVFVFAIHPVKHILTKKSTHKKSNGLSTMFFFLMFSLILHITGNFTIQFIIQFGELNFSWVIMFYIISPISIIMLSAFLIIKMNIKKINLHTICIGLFGLAPIGCLILGDYNYSRNEIFATLIVFITMMGVFGFVYLRIFILFDLVDTNNFLYAYGIMEFLTGFSVLFSFFTNHERVSESKNIIALISGITTLSIGLIQHWFVSKTQKQVVEPVKPI